MTSYKDANSSLTIIDPHFFHSVTAYSHENPCLFVSIVKFVLNNSSLRVPPWGSGLQRGQGQ